MSLLPTVTIAANAVHAKLIDADREVRAVVQQILSYRVDGCENMSRFKTTAWDGRSSFLGFVSGTFPAGFLHLVAAHLRRRGYKVNIVRKPLPAPLGPENPVVDEFGEDPRYDYQRDVVERLVRHGMIIAQVATGGGKSRIAKIAVQRINRPTLFITTRSILMYQMAKQFKALGKSPGIVGDSHWLPRVNGVTCAMVQTLVARLAEPDVRWPADKIIEHNRLRADTIRLLENFELVILEEAHEASGNSYYDILAHCKNAHYRLALTATPFMKDDQEANMKLMACSGPIGIKISEKMLIDRGILARPVIKYVPMAGMGKPKMLMRSTPWQPAYRLGIVDNEFRNRAIVFEAMRAAQHGLSVIVLTLQKEHGNNLLTMFRDAGAKVDYIAGKDDQVVRQRALNRLQRKELEILIGSTILDVGVDVPAVGMIILAGGGKAEVALRQRIGRGLREKKTGPNIALVVDFADDANNHLRSHYKQRRAIVEDTPGFVENVLGEREDFNFVALGFEKAAA